MIDISWYVHDIMSWDVNIERRLVPSGNDTSLANWKHPCEVFIGKSWNPRVTPIWTIPDPAHVHHVFKDTKSSMIPSQGCQGYHLEHQ